jgi:hypothetical protein
MRGPSPLTLVYDSIDLTLLDLLVDFKYVQVNKGHINRDMPRRFILVRPNLRLRLRRIRGCTLGHDYD